MRGAMSRAVKSFDPPGAKGTMKRMGRVGYGACAIAGAANSNARVAKKKRSI
jgi:hypothetical protein